MNLNHQLWLPFIGAPLPLPNMTCYVGGDLTMKATINWETDFNQALTRSKAEHKPVLLDFFNPQ